MSRRNLERHIPLDKLSLKDVQLTKQESGLATATLVLHNEALNKDFLAKLLLQSNDAGDWQIRRISPQRSRLFPEGFVMSFICKF